MVGKQFLIEGVQGSVGGGDLYQNIRTIGVFLHHAPNASNLPFDAVQTVDQFGVFLLRAFLCLVTTGTSLFFCMFHSG